MAKQGLTVAVTGPTGDLGLAIVSALERSRAVRRVVAMARRPFDPDEQGWRKTEYVEGDVQDERSVRDLVRDADVVVHLAFAILDAGEATRERNVEGSRRVFELAARAGVRRICYASSVAAYGFHEDNPDWLDEDVPARGTPGHFYSQQKAEVEGVLGSVLLRHPGSVAYAFRPCVVAGPRAQTLLEQIPYVRMSDALPDVVRSLLSSMPIPKPVIPDPGVAFQLVHEDDVAAAFLAGVTAKGARPLQPRRPGHADDLGPGGRARLAHGARARAGRERRGRGGVEAAAAGRRVVDPRRAQARADEDRPRAARASLEARAHGQGHAARAGGRPARGQAGATLSYRARRYSDS